MKLWSGLAVLAAATMLGGQDARQDEGPVVGKAAPTLRLNDDTGRAVKIGPSKEGRWTVLAFYPKASTPG